MESFNWQERQSTVIEAIRFPLIILVVFGHMLPFECVPMEMNFSAKSIFIFTSELITHNLATIVLGCFFLFSGYFFFIKMQHFSVSFYIEQLKKRLNTLLVPYIIWNLLLIIAIFLKNQVFMYFQLDADEAYVMINKENWFDLFWTMPVNFPLWYVRDLMCMTVISPVFYLFFRYTKFFGLIFLILLYLTTWAINIPGFHPRAITFFGIGAFLGIYKYNILTISKRYSMIFLVAASISLVLATIYSATPIHAYLANLFSIVGVPASLILVDRLIKNNAKLKNKLLILAGTSFFVYALHLIYITGWIKGFFLKFSFFSENGIGMLTWYFTAPIIVLFICLGLFYLTKKIAPRLLAVLTGGRIFNKLRFEKNKKSF